MAVVKRKYVKDAKARIEAIASELGKVSDRAIAARIGVSASSVANYRKAHGIKAERSTGKRGKKVAKAPSKKAASTKSTSRRRGSRVDAFKELVGTVPDRVIAEKAGVTIGAVQGYRRRHGIPPWSLRNAKPAATTADVGRSVWRILGTEEAIYVVAGSLVDAARQAQDAGHTAGLERVGDAL